MEQFPISDEEKQEEYLDDSVNDVDRGSCGILLIIVSILFVLTGAANTATGAITESMALVGIGIAFLVASIAMLVAGCCIKKTAGHGARRASLTPIASSMAYQDCSNSPQVLDPVHINVALQRKRLSTVSELNADLLPTITNPLYLTEERNLAEMPHASGPQPTYLKQAILPKVVGTNISPANSSITPCMIAEPTVVPRTACAASSCLRTPEEHSTRCASPSPSKSEL
eukprot:scpid74361/ scgid2949/ 